MRDFLSQLGREAPALSRTRSILLLYIYQSYATVSKSLCADSLVILAGSSSWLANMPNASINICDYKLQIWSKYLNTSSVTSGFNMVSIPRKASAHSHSRSRSHSPNHVSRSRWILIPNGTFGLAGLAWPQVPAMLIAKLIEVCTSTLLCMYYARTQIDFLSSTIPARKATSSDAQQSALKCHDICLSLSLMSVWRFQALLLQKHCLSYCERK